MQRLIDTINNLKKPYSDAVIDDVQYRIIEHLNAKQGIGSDIFLALVHEEDLFDKLQISLIKNPHWCYHYFEWLYYLTTSNEHGISNTWISNEIKRYHSEVLQCTLITHYPESIHTLERANMDIPITVRNEIIWSGVFFQNIPQCLKSDFYIDMIYGVYPTTDRHSLSIPEIDDIVMNYLGGAYKNSKSFHEEILEWVLHQENSNVLRLFDIINDYIGRNPNNLVISEAVTHHIVSSLTISRYKKWNKETRLALLGEERCLQIDMLSTLVEPYTLLKDLSDLSNSSYIEVNIHID